jgi:hypothetical protein
METVHVGTFVGADQAEPPPAGGPTRRQAYRDCFASAKEFLGDDYRIAPLALSVAVPVESDWTAGARWFRCDLAYLDYDQIQPRPGSLRGALAGAKPMLLRCLKAASTATRVDFNGSVPCTTPHEIEFAGIYDAPDGPYPTDEKGRRRMIETGCRGVVAAFAGVPDDAQLPRRTSWVYGDIPETQWQLGNRGVPCYVAPRAPVSRSLQDAGPRALPAR